MKILALMTIYRPPIANLESALASVVEMESVSRLVIVISQESPTNVKILVERYRHLTSKAGNCKIDVIHQMENHGLGEALNIGVDYIKSLPEHFDYTLVTEDDAEIIAPPRELIGNRDGGWLGEHDILLFSDQDIRVGAEHSPIETIKPFGTNIFICRLSVLKEIKFREGFFLDQIDIDF